MKYSSEFKCLKEKCPNSCCSKTEIKLSVIDLLKINEILELKYEKGSFKFKDGSAKLYFDARTKNPYAVMNNKNNDCPLLKNGLCIIHEEEIKSRVGKALKDKGLSTSALPLICRSYPTAIFYPETGKLELNSGCKGVKDMKWEYVIKTPELVQTIRETSLYNEVIKKIKNEKIIKQLENNNFFKKVLEELESTTNE